VGAIFKKEVPDSRLPYTGERLSAGHQTQTEIEHYHRYYFARHYCCNKDVLDIASGEGYGSAILSQVASSVIGVDISEEAVAHAQTAHVHPNLKFLKGDTCHIPVADNSIDIVVSFETLEHFGEHHEFMKEVKRILRPDGRLIISTPDRDIYSPVGTEANPYHVLELTKQEFIDISKHYFQHIRMVNQRTLVGSALIVDDNKVFERDSIVFEHRGDTHVEVSQGLPRAPYLICIASDTDIPIISNSLLIDSYNVADAYNHAANHAANHAKQQRVNDANKKFSRRVLSWLSNKLVDKLNEPS